MGSREISLSKAMKYLISFLLVNCGKILDGRIIFGNELEDILEEQREGRMLTEHRNNSESALCPDNLDWCDQPQQYPEINILKAVIKQKKAVKILFENESQPKNLEVGLRMFDTEWENICNVETSYIMPRAAKNKKGKFMFIVNQPKGAVEYIQKIRVATCTAAGDECGEGRLASPVSTQCHQEYSDHKLVALSDTGEELIVETFSFPSCCTCLMESTLEL